MSIESFDPYLNKMKRWIIHFFNDTHFSELFKYASTAFTLRAIGASLTFFFTIYLTRVIGAKDYGQFMLALTIISIISVANRLGLENVMVARISTAHETKATALIRGYFRTAVWMVFWVGVVLTFAGYFILPWIVESIFNKPEIGKPLTQMIWILIPLSLMPIIAEALRGVRQVADSTTTQVVLIPGMSLFLFMLGDDWINWNLSNVIGIYACAVLFSTLFAWFRWRSVIKKGNTIYPDIKKMLQSGIPLLLGTSGGLVMAWSDTLILGIFENIEVVGIYSAASRAALLTSLIPVSVNAIAGPKFAAFYSNGNLLALAKLSRQATLLSTVLISLPTAIMIFYPEQVLQLFGKEFLIGASTLLILSAAQLISVGLGSVGCLLMMTGNERIFRDVLLVTAVINIGLNIILVKSYGMLGVAVATATSKILWNLWMLISVRRKLGFWTIPVPLFKLG